VDTHYEFQKKNPREVTQPTEKKKRRTHLDREVGERTSTLSQRNKRDGVFSREKSQEMIDTRRPEMDAASKGRGGKKSSCETDRGKERGPKNIPAPRKERQRKGARIDGSYEDKTQPAESQGKQHQKAVREDTGNRGSAGRCRGGREASSRKREKEERTDKFHRKEKRGNPLHLSTTPRGKEERKRKKRSLNAGKRRVRKTLTWAEKNGGKDWIPRRCIL